MNELRKFQITVNGAPYPTSAPATVDAYSRRDAVERYIQQRWNGWPPATAPYNISALAA